MITGNLKLIFKINKSSNTSISIWEERGIRFGEVLLIFTTIKIELNNVVHLRGQGMAYSNWNLQYPSTGNVSVICFSGLSIQVCW